MLSYKTNIFTFKSQRGIVALAAKSVWGSEIGRYDDYKSISFVVFTIKEDSLFWVNFINSAVSNNI